MTVSSPHIAKMFDFFSPDEKIRLVLDDIKIEIPQGMEVHDDTVGLNLPLTVMGRDALRHVKVPMFIDVPRKIGIGDQGSVECSVVHRLVAKYCPAVSVTSTTLSEKSTTLIRHRFDK